MSGWDWVHAGLEIATYSQARKARQNVESLQDAVESAAAAAEIEAARRAMIEAMRNFVFDISRDIQRAEEYIDQFPTQVYIVARALEYRFQDSGLSPAVFPEFSDKEYVDKTQQKIATVLSASCSKLTDDQVQQAALAIKALTELPLLHEAVQAKSSLEQIQATEGEWKDLENSVNGVKTKKNLGILALMGSPCLCLGITSANGSTTAGGLFGLIVLVAATALLASKPDTAKHNKLKTQRDHWRKNLLPANVWNQVVEKFGDQSSEQYKKLVEDRIAFLNPILGNEFQRFLAGS